MKFYWIIFSLSFLVLSACDSGKKTEKNTTANSGNTVELTQADIESSMDLALKNPEKVEFLRLSKRNLKEWKIKDISQFKNLKGAYLGENPDLKIDEIVEQLAQAPNLTELELSGNQLTHLPKALAKCKNLKTIWLVNNPKMNFTEAIAELASLPNLMEVWLSDNGLVQLPENLDKLQNLEILYLNANNFAKLPNNLGKLPKLHTLSLVAMQNMDLPMILKQLKELKNLEVLILSANRLTEIPENIGDLASLKILWLDSNEIKALPTSLTRLNNLDEIYLQNNPLLPETEAGLPQLLPRTRKIVTRPEHLNPNQ
ncbi:MAG: leucine-rich repeat domain-containing protein [Microscillaceae bacterium]|jgi:Leucine-rich repeat (LRR) protein|nr:leucine-rich repeat domain-containing protein [Microscillaceae bacterium]